MTAPPSQSSPRQNRRAVPWIRYVRAILPMLLMVALIAGFGVFWFLPALKDVLLEQRCGQTKDLVRTVWSIASDLHQRALGGHMTEAEAKHLFVERVARLRYGEEMKDYYWIHDLDGVIISHPYHDKVDLSSYVDSSGIHVVPEMNRIARARGEGFLNYTWQWNDREGDEAQKISYVKLFEPWGWVIGSGFYREEVDREINRLTASFVRFMGLGALLLFLLISLAILRSLRSTYELAEKDEQVRASESRFRNMSEHVTHGLAIFEEGRLAFLNPRMREIFDLPTDPGGCAEALSRISGQLFATAPERPEQVPGFSEDPLRQGQWYQTARGEPRFLFAQRIRHPGKDEHYLVVRDWTVYKRHEDQAQSLGRIIQECPLSVIITDAKGTITYANPYTRTLTGREPEALVGRHISVLKSDRVPPETYTQMWETLRRREIWRGELPNRRPNGEQTWEFVVMAPLFGPDNAISQFFVVTSDITERKTLETALIEARDKARESERMKSAFLTNVSHEIRTPLNAISGFNQILAGEFGDHPEFESCWRMIDENVTILLDLVDDILKVSQLEAGKLVPEYHEWSLDDIVREAVEAIRQSRVHAPRRTVEFQLSLDARLQDELVLTDRDKLRSILHELLVNSAKFTVQGTITIGYEVKDDEVVLFVRDTGSGISDEVKPKVFNLFYHGEDQYVALHKGTGLGLNLVRRLVTLMGGKIWFESAPGEGTTFFVSGVCRPL